MIFGVDLGTRRLAIACPQVSFVWSMSLERAADRRRYASELDAGLALGRAARAELIDHGVGNEDWCGDTWLFFAERPFLRTQRPNVQTAVGMALSAGAALSQLPGGVVLHKHPTVWKKALCDNGNADKDQVRRVVTDRLPEIAALCGENQDLYDAVGIALGSAALAQDGGL